MPRREAGCGSVAIVVGRFTPLGDLRDSLYGEIAINPCTPEFLLVGVRRGGLLAVA